MIVNRHFTGQLDNRSNVVETLTFVFDRDIMRSCNTDGTFLVLRLSICPLVDTGSSV